MRTIVINTSKEAINTKLDVLFKAPFDQSSLLWYESNLADIAKVADEIKQTLIIDTDIVDRDYNLIVLVDLYGFPRGNEKDAVEVYKPLVARYIGFTLLKRLCVEFSLLPVATSVYFVDSASRESAYVPDDVIFGDNPIDQSAKQAKELLQEEKRQAQLISADANGDLSDDAAVPKTVNKVSREFRERLIMELFSWEEDIEPQDEFSWKLKASLGDEESLDFTLIFANDAKDIKSSHPSAKVLEIALRAVNSMLDANSGSWSDMAEIDLPFISGQKIVCLTCKFQRDNEQMLIEGFFNLFANVFTCVQTKALSSAVVTYDVEQIKDMLLYALKKYKYFSDENNINLNFQPVADIFAYRESIYATYKQNMLKSEGVTDRREPQDEAEAIMNGEKSGKQTRKITGVKGIDSEFYSLIEDIFDNYDPEIIERQNNRVVNESITGLWSRRDKHTAEEFRAVIDLVIDRDLKGKTSQAKPNTKRDNISFLVEEHEKEYSDLINDVTEAEHSISANKNILLETKNIIIKYGDLMRKGKWYLISVIGALIAIFVSILPFIYVEHYSGSENLLSKVMYVLFTAGFAALYGISSSIYMIKNRRKKLYLLSELKILKDKSKEERLASIVALIKYYRETVIKAESHYLLWQEILRRDRENAQKGIMRNNHIKHLELLFDEVERFITMLKFGHEGKGCDASEADIKRFEEEGLCLNAEETFHSEANQKVYSVLYERTDKEKGEE